MSENLYFYKGLEKDLPRTGIKIGALYHCTDTKNTYIGKTATTMELWSSATSYQQLDGGVVIGTGDAKGKYSIAGGTNDKQLVTDIVGSIADDYIDIEPSESNGSMSVSYGAGNITHSSASNAFGIKNQGGFLGYYIASMSEDKTSLTLSTSQDSTVKPNANILRGWQKGWTVTIINDVLYPECATIDSVNTTDGTVTFTTALPFDTIVKPNKILGISQEVPHDRSIIAIPPVGTKTIGAVGIASKTFDTYRPAAIGEVELGFSATTFGFDNIAAGTLSTAFGYRNTALGTASFVTGRENIGGFATLVGGYNNIVTGQDAFASGRNNIVSGDHGHVEGADNTVEGKWGHAEGKETWAMDNFAHAEGYGSAAVGKYSHAGGYYTLANANGSYTEGCGTWALGEGSHAEGNVWTVPTSELANYTLQTTNPNKAQLLLSGNIVSPSTLRLGEGDWISVNNKKYRITTIDGMVINLSGIGGAGYLSNATYDNTKFKIMYSNRAVGQGSHVEGSGNIAQGDNSHSEGRRTVSQGINSHAEGLNTQAIGNQSHAEGNATISSGSASHAEGKNSTSSGSFSHAEGENSYAAGHRSHAEGDSTHAYGAASHAEGKNTYTYGVASHAEGEGTVTRCNNQHVQGRYNIEDNSKAFIIGNGSGEDVLEEVDPGEFEIIEQNRSNAHTVDWYGNAWYAGNVETDNIFKSETQIFQTNLASENAIPLTSENMTMGVTGILPASHGGTGNNSGYIRAGLLANGAIGDYATAEGDSTQAGGSASHAEGWLTSASGNYSHASGTNTIAAKRAQFVIGNYNKEDDGTTTAYTASDYGEYVFIIGAGSSSARKNIHTVDWRGNAWYAGNIITDKTLTAKYLIVTDTLKAYHLQAADGESAVHIADDLNMDGGLTVDAGANIIGNLTVNGDAVVDGSLQLGKIILSTPTYGTSLPVTGTKGQLFFKKV